MKKVIYKFFLGEGNPNNSVEEIGFVEEVKWKSVGYFGGPKEDGTYITTGGDGKYFELQYACSGLTIFNQLVGGSFDEIEIDGKEPTDELMMKLARAENGVWYDTYPISPYGEYCGDGIDIYIDDEEGVPKYFLDINLDNAKIGPIDEEEKSYEIVEINNTDW